MEVKKESNEGRKEGKQEVSIYYNGVLEGNKGTKEVKKVRKEEKGGS